MARTPIAVGLTLCDYVIVEAMTHKISLVGCLTDIAVDELPGLAEPFSAVAFLTDAQGTIDLELTVEDAATAIVVDRYQQRIYSPGPLSVVYCNIRATHSPFPRPGVYVFSLWSNGQVIAERRASVYRRGDRS